MIVRVDRELMERIKTAKKRLGSEGPRFPVLHDPLEDEEEWAEIIRAAKKRADAEVDARPRRGRLHCVFEVARVILKREHGINWYSPYEMNPGIRIEEDY